MVLGNLLGGFIVILVGVSLVPTIGNQVDVALYHGSNESTPTNLTGAAATITDLSTLFFALGIMSAGVALAVNGLKQSGMI